MSQPQLLKKVIQVLEESGIPYMLTGSIVSSLQGEPRATHDIDIIVTLKPASISRLLAAFPSPDYYLDREAIVEALARRGMFNLIDTHEGDKVDFWILTPDPFDQSRFTRRSEEAVLGTKMKVSRPEDTILAKLRWAKLSGGSEKHFTDALRVYEVQGEKLDKTYLDFWAAKLEVESLWKQLLAAAKTD